jgi:hypothetical protein
MPEEEAQDSESDFKPNLVNSVCYLVEQVGARARVCVCVCVCVVGWMPAPGTLGAEWLGSIPVP